jgi:hypothetical protein
MVSYVAVTPHQTVPTKDSNIKGLGCAAPSTPFAQRQGLGTTRPLIVPLHQRLDQPPSHPQETPRLALEQIIDA